MKKLIKKNKNGTLVDLGIPKTAGVDDLMNEDESFEEFVNESLKRYFRQDWGDVSEGDRKMNDEAVRIGERIHAAYIFPQKWNSPYPYEIKIWIITEWDRSATTILFPEEY